MHRYASLLTRYFYCDNLPSLLVWGAGWITKYRARTKELGGTGEDKKTVTISREEVYLAMRRDLGRIRGHLLQVKL
jgi:hypothetical protein